MAHDSFGTYLDTLARLRGGHDEDDQGAVATAESSAEGDTAPVGASIAVVVSLLAASGGEMTFDELLGATRLTPNAFAAAVATLVQGGIVSVNDGAAPRTLQLTPAVRKLLEKTPA